jgi:hypothetical protein
MPRSRKIDLEKVRASQYGLPEQGNVIGRTHKIYSRHPVQYRFDELYAAFSDYLDAVMIMLQKLSEIEILRR